MHKLVYQRIVAGFQLRRRAGKNDRAISNHDRLVANGERLVYVMADDDCG